METLTDDEKILLSQAVAEGITNPDDLKAWLWKRIQTIQGWTKSPAKEKAIKEYVWRETLKAHKA